MCLSMMMIKVAHAASPRMTQQEAANVIASVGFPPPIVPIMTCIALHESSFRTTILNYNTNHTIDYGFLQVNTIWLKPCHATPESILDVYTNAKCALLVYHQQGLTAWVTFRKFKQECLAYKVSPSKEMVKENDYLIIPEKIKL